MLKYYVILLSSMLPAFAGNAPPLGTWTNVNPGLITVSGLSAGGAFATQFHVAFSDDIVGVGSFAGVADTCFVDYSYFCMTAPAFESTHLLVRNVEALDRQGRIDPTANMANHK